MPVASQPEVAPAPTGPRPLVERIEALPDPERAFARLYGESRAAFWLDSSAGGERGRFSLMGDAGGPLGAVATYDVEAGRVRIERGGAVEERRESIFAWIGREVEALGEPPRGLPDALGCGLVGYLGYELKAECDSPNRHRSPRPDAALIRPSGLVALDRLEGCTYLVGPEEWIEATAGHLRRLPDLPAPAPGTPAALRLARSRERYLDDIAACQRRLRAGHSYEICLTNRVAGELSAEPLELYRALRRANPAPFAAYLRFGGLAVLSSSPERFLAVDRDGRAEARPIKGTVRRGATPAEDAALAAALRGGEKFRAENVTIVDLLRNDLGRVCEVGTVEAPELMRVETYETVHQLVSAVRGRLRPGLGAAEAVRACFPPGSMTGAPKLRTMEILERLEGEARGVYSGAIGWFGAGGACDLSVAIRTIVLADGTATIGAGGAIVVDSDPEEELAEMLLKAAAPAAALGGGASISFSPAAAPGDSRRRPPHPTPS